MDLRDCVAIIPARAGSKRIPRKNFTPIAPDGRTPLQLAIDCALWAGMRDIIVTTDEPRPCCLAPVIWDRRPPELAQDDTPMQAVVEYLLNKYRGAAFCLLQPTQPLRKPSHIRRAVELLTFKQDSVVTIGLDRFVRDGTAYVFWRRTVERYGNIYGPRNALMGIPAEETAPLDTPQEWEEAKGRLEHALR